MQSKTAGLSYPIEDAIMRNLFMDVLPSRVASLLAITGKELSLEMLAQQADDILEVDPSYRVSAVKSSTDTVGATAEASGSQQTLVKAIADLQSQVANLTMELRYMKEERSRSRERGNQWERRRSQSNQRRPLKEGEVCYYHETFGEKARRCRKGCAKASKND